MAYGRKGKGILIHSLTDAAGMPLANRTTSANGNERAQVLPLLAAIHLRTGQRGRPRKRPKVIVTDKGYDATDLRQQLRTRGIRAQIPKRVWNTTRSRGRPIKIDVPRFQAERTLAWLQQKDLRLVVRWERLTAVAGNGQVAVGCADKQGGKDSSTQYEGYSRKYARALHLLRVSRMPRRCPGLTPRLTITRVADGYCNSSLYAVIL